MACCGSCNQGRAPCPHPEDCLAADPPLTRGTVLMAVALVAAAWGVVGVLAGGVTCLMR